jgi:predicted nucleotidyltransferase
MSALTASRAAYAARPDSGVARVVEALRELPDVRRVSVFGSYARGRRDLFTDLDILVVMETRESVPERLAREA